MPASKLAKLQHDFLKAFYQKKPEPFLQHVDSKTALTPEKRFAIYQGSITECLARSLRETYKVCEKLVGEDFFNGSAYTFIQETPSYSANLDDYGAPFADFIEHFPPAQQLPYLADLCRLCWSYHLAYDAQEERVVDIKIFSALSDEEKAQTIFTLPKSTHLLESPYPIKKIWELCVSNAPENHEAIDLMNGGIKLMVWRHSQQVVIDELSEYEWQLANGLTQQLTLEQLEQYSDSKKISLVDLLPEFLINRWLVIKN